MLQPRARCVEHQWQAGFEAWSDFSLSKLDARGDKLIWIADCLQHPLPLRRILVAQHRVADLAQQFEVGIGPGDATVQVQIAWPLDGAPLVAISSRGDMGLKIEKALFTIGSSRSNKNKARM